MIYLFKHLCDQNPLEKKTAENNAFQYLLTTQFNKCSLLRIKIFLKLKKKMTLNHNYNEKKTLQTYLTNMMRSF